MEAEIIYHNHLNFVKLPVKSKCNKLANAVGGSVVSLLLMEKVRIWQIIMEKKNIGPWPHMLISGYTHGNEYL